MTIDQAGRLVELVTLPSLADCKYLTILTTMMICPNWVLGNGMIFQAFILRHKAALCGIVVAYTALLQYTWTALMRVSTTQPPL